MLGERDSHTRTTIVLIALAASVVLTDLPAEAAPAMTMTTPAFETGAEIPVEYTCDGANASPELRVAKVPSKTVELVLVVDDPDAPGGTFTHWLLYAISPKTKTIARNGVPKGAREGSNDAGSAGWTGPCPPPGQAHRYFFTLHALKARSGLPSGANAADVERAIDGKHIAAAQTMGTYCRRLVGELSSCLFG